MKNSNLNANMNSINKLLIVRVCTLFVFLCYLGSCKNQIANEFYVEDVSSPEILLDGKWQLNLNPETNFYNQLNNNQNWKDVHVPGELMMQGFAIEHDKPFAYQKTIEIPYDYSGKRIFLRFEGVYSYAKIWINGNYIGEHSGGFTKWENEITTYVEPGKDAILSIEVTDKKDEISYGSGYAKHLIGGILRSVNLLALPENFPDDITITTDFDKGYTNCNLTVAGMLNQTAQENTAITINLKNKNGDEIHLGKRETTVSDGKYFYFSNKINEPLKWDAEHPNLYTLTISLLNNGKLAWAKNYKVGFRELEVVGNSFLVNGSEIKLRGACRHDMHPLLGRVSTTEYELKDVLLAKEANMNFIRTSHYPPTDNFLALCDEYGLYVEDEAAISFVDFYRTKDYAPGATQDNADYSDRYLSQLGEMVDNHKNHPSVIIWSIGNESKYAANFQKSYNLVKEKDKTRPVIFSYPGTVPDSVVCYDLLSVHYPPISGNREMLGIRTEKFGYSKMPALFDEWAHVACYSNSTIREDPNVRDFWGRSLDVMWDKCFKADGGLGGAIWGMIDETFMLPDSLKGLKVLWGKLDTDEAPAEYLGNTIGYGEWGIVDVWRRKKPEFWQTKKAYSPVKLLQTIFKEENENNSINIPIYNRFDHTNINELKVKLTVNGDINKIQAPDIPSHSKGILSISAKRIKAGDEIFLEFLTHNDKQIEKSKLIIGEKPKFDRSIKYGQAPKIKEDGQLLTIIGENQMKIVFDKNTGSIEGIQSHEGSLKLKGPHLNLRTEGKAIIESYNEIKEYGNNWELKSFTSEVIDNKVVLKIDGIYSSVINCSFNFYIYSNGLCNVEYNIKNIPKEFIREIGLVFEIENTADTISWIREGFRSYYPTNELSANKGAFPLFSSIANKYRTKPEKDWVLDTKSFFYNGTENEVPEKQLTYGAKSTKENISEYHLLKKGNPVFSVYGDGDVNVRLALEDDKLLVYTNNDIDYVDLDWGNYQRNIKLEGAYSGKVSFRLMSTGYKK